VEPWVLLVHGANHDGWCWTPVLDRLARHGVLALRTDQQGLITIRTDGRRLDVETHSGFLGRRY